MSTDPKPTVDPIVSAIFSRLGKAGGAKRMASLTPGDRKALSASAHAGKAAKKASKAS